MTQQLTEAQTKDYTTTRYITRFSTLANALSYRNTRNSYKTTPIILGDDNKFWLAKNNNVAYKLNDQGYDFA